MFKVNLGSPRLFKNITPTFPNFKVQRAFNNIVPMPIKSKILFRQLNSKNILQSNYDLIKSRNFCDEKPKIEISDKKDSKITMNMDTFISMLNGPKKSPKTYGEIITDITTFIIKCAIIITFFPLIAIAILYFLTTVFVFIGIVIELIYSIFD